MRQKAISFLAALGFFLASQNGDAQNQSYYFLKDILDGTGIIVEDNPANYPIYDALADNIRKISSRVTDSASLSSWYQTEDMILSDYVDLTDSLHSLLLDATGLEAYVSDEAIEMEIGALADRAFEILRTAEFAGVPLFAGGTLSAIAEAFRVLPEFRDLNALNMFQALLAAEKSFVESRMDSYIPEDWNRTIQQDILVMNLLLLEGRIQVQ